MMILFGDIGHKFFQLMKSSPIYNFVESDIKYKYIAPPNNMLTLTYVTRYIKH